MLTVPVENNAGLRRRFRAAAVGSGLFFLTYALVYLLHVRFFTVDVVLYAAVLDALIAALIASGALALLRWFDPLNSFEKLLLAMIWLLSGMLFALAVPTVIDRSLSFYLLEKLQQRGGGIRVEGFEAVFRDEYLREHRLVDVRLTEQIASGTIRIEGECVLLTGWGRALAAGSRAFRRNLLPRHRLLMGEYTDDLTDPFREQPMDFDYTCSGTGK